MCRPCCRVLPFLVVHLSSAQRMKRPPDCECRRFPDFHSCKFFLRDWNISRVAEVNVEENRRYPPN